MFSTERMPTREVLWPQYSACEEAVVPPLIPVAAGGLSGRPRCRIFPMGHLWVLQVETAAGWLIGDDSDEPPIRLMFPTLIAAIAHAELHGLDYRIIRPAPITRFPDRRHVGLAGGSTTTGKNRKEY